MTFGQTLQKFLLFSELVDVSMFFLKLQLNICFSGELQ